MKKFLKIIIILGLLFLIFQFAINLLIQKHNVNYSILTDNNSFDVNERFDKNVYYFRIKDKKKMIFNFYASVDYNKQEKIIKNIRYFKSDDLVCILPVYKKGKVGNLLCNYNNEQVSYSYLKQTGNKSIDNIIDLLKKDGIRSDEWNYSDSLKKMDGIKVYTKNIDDNYIFTTWFYKGIYIIDNKKIDKRELLDLDSYENNYSRLVGKYYVTFNTDNVSNYKFYEIITYNVQDGGKKKIELDNISLNSYINGIYDNKLYFTDLDSKIQYVVDPYKNSISKLNNYNFYYNGKMRKISKNKFFDSNKIFSYDILDKRISKKYGNVEIKKYNDLLYFKTGDGVVYEIINNDINNPIKLFQFRDLVDWNVKDGIVSVIDKNTMYSYSNLYGLRPIIVNDELKYNYNNICDFMKK